jgi:hypothetical protein
MNEAETRAEHIDPALKAAGWGVVEGSRIRREYPITPGRIALAVRDLVSQMKTSSDPNYCQRHMMCATFWHPDGTPMSAQQFMEMLFGKLPEFFKDEDELRAIWSAPDTRKKLLQGLSEKGFGHEQLAEMQKIIDAEKSDLFDVLAHVACALAPLTREERASGARVIISTHFNTRQRVFHEFVLSHYVSVGLDELDTEKLTPLLRLKYHNSIADAVADLGRPDEIGRVFSGFQKYLYQQQAVARMNRRNVADGLQRRPAISQRFIASRDFGRSGWRLLSATVLTMCISMYALKMPDRNLSGPKSMALRAPRQWLACMS